VNDKENYVRQYQKPEKVLKYIYKNCHLKLKKNNQLHLRLI